MVKNLCSELTRGSKIFSPLTNLNGSYHVAKEQDVSQLANMDNGMLSDGSRDVSPSANADGGRSRAKEGANVDRSHSVHYQLLTAGSPSSGCGQEDVSPPTVPDEGQHGAKEGGEE